MTLAPDAALRRRREVVARGGRMRSMGQITVVAIEADERVWVTGDVHLDPGDAQRAQFFLRFLSEARRSADRLVLLGDVFDYWIGPRHGRSSSYRPVIEAFEEAAREGFPLDFVAGNRDFLGPSELRSIGLRVHGDAVVFDRQGQRTLVTSTLR